MKPARKEEPESKAKKYAMPAAVLAVLLAGAYGVYHLVSGDSPRKRVLDTVAIKLVEPPPPPKVEPPPEPPKMVEEQKIEPPVDKPMDAPKDAPPPGPLALDAKGEAGGDAFGLGGKIGGADYTGGGGGGTRFGHFTSLLQTRLTDLLRDDEKLRKAKYRGNIRVWVTDSGKVRAELLHTTGDKNTDRNIEQSINAMSALAESPPKEMPQPVVFSISGQPGLG